MSTAATVAESDATTEHTIMTMETIVTELSACAIDDARDVVNAAQIMLRGNRDQIRNLCKPWGVQLTVQKTQTRFGKYQRRS